MAPLVVSIFNVYPEIMMMLLLEFVFSLPLSRLVVFVVVVAIFSAIN
jgi:hypothetical protein